MPEISLPTPGVTPGPGWAEGINTAIEAVNSSADATAHTVNAGRLSETELNATIGNAVSGKADAGRVSLPQHISRLYPTRLANWHAGVSAVLAGERDAKLLVVGDSTAGGVGGGSASSFIQANSWPSKMVPLLDRLIAPTAHGLAAPPSNSGAVTSPYDSRWTLGEGWTWRRTDDTDKAIGFGGKGTSVRGGAGGGLLVFGDPRIMADAFDVWIVVNNGGTGATYSMQATGGAVVTGQTFSQPAAKLVKVTLEAGSAATTNTVTIERTGGSGAIYVVGIEPYLSTSRKIRVANAGISGSNTAGWLTRPPQDTPWHGLGLIEEYAPDLTIIDLGINDADPANVTSPATFAANLAQIIAAAQVSGDVILKSMIPSDATRHAHEALLVAELAKFGLPMVDTFGYYGTWDSALMTDGVHGNASMYTDEADYLTGVLYASRNALS